MNSTTLAALFSWPLITLIGFVLISPRRAVIVGFLGAYVLLPSRAGIALSGLPDYTKFLAADLGVLSGLFIFDLGRLFALRPRWFDLPIVGWCLVPAISIATNGLAAWDAVSAVADQVIHWGIPYLVGRLYFNEFEAVRDLALGVVLGGAITAPMALFEVITEQSLSGLVYGVRGYSGYKYGLYSPVVFLTNQLEVGLWMATAAITAFWLWCTHSVSRLLGLPFGIWTLVVILGAVLCHQTGALALMAGCFFLIAGTSGRESLANLFTGLAALGALSIIPKTGIRRSFTCLLGLGLFHLFRLRHPQVIAWILIAIAPLYITVRSSGLWSGSQIRLIISDVIGSDRAWSLRYRMINEDRMVRHVASQPLFGWGTFEDDRGKGDAKITDGTWMIYLGKYGYVGIASLYATLCVPQFLISRRYPVSTWTDPTHTPPIALMFMVTTYTLDSLLNAYTPNPIYIVAIGGLVGLPPVRSRPQEQPSERSTTDKDRALIQQLISAGRWSEAETRCQHLLAIRSAQAGSRACLAWADALDQWAKLLEATDRGEEAESARRQAITVLEQVANDTSWSQAAQIALASHYEQLARSLADRQLTDHAVEAWEHALEFRAQLVTERSDDPSLLRFWADGLNNLAWLLAHPDTLSTDHDPDHVVHLAEQAVRLDPACKTYWNTLSAAYCRLGWPDAAMNALEQSRRLGTDSTGFDHVLLALALAQQKHYEAARDTLVQLDARLATGRHVSPSLLRWHNEAERILNNIPSTSET